MPFRRIFLFAGCLLSFLLILHIPMSQAQFSAKRYKKLVAAYQKDPNYQEYLSFFQEVFKTMNDNYYHNVTREGLSKFLYVFNTRIFPQLLRSGKTKQYIKWRSAAYMVEALRSEDDIFSAFFPPQAAKEYEEAALGKRIDLGIEGELTDQGYLVTWVEPRADAFEKGLRENDVITAVDGEGVISMTEEAIRNKLTPLENESVVLDYIAAVDQEMKTIEVVSKEYFKQFVFRVPVDVPGIFCIQLQKFNRMTPEDFTKVMVEAINEKAKGLIIDLRGNPGGPPLAAREISAFFLPPKEEFAYFQMKGRPKAKLFVPDLPRQYHYDGELVILVDEKSGSASELFSGILKGRKRATIIGRNTAGQVFLKSMFYFEDDSMVLLVTARGHHPDGKVFSFSGVEPDQKVEDPEVDLVHYAAEYLAQKYRNNQQ